MELAETVIGYLKGTRHIAGGQFDDLLDDDGSRIRTKAKESNKKQEPRFRRQLLICRDA